MKHFVNVGLFLHCYFCEVFPTDLGNISGSNAVNLEFEIKYDYLPVANTINIHKFQTLGNFVVIPIKTHIKRSFHREICQEGVDGMANA